MACCRDVDHRRRDVESRRVRAPRDRSRGDFPRACSDVENPYACSDAGCIEKRADGLARDRAQEFAIASGDALPPGRLELVECASVVRQFSTLSG
jgi:hypothetical protein